MKKLGKKAYAIILTWIFILSVGGNLGTITASAAAGDIINSTTNVTYTTLTGALAAAVGGDTLTLTGNITESVVYTADNLDKSITINGAGYTITGVAATADNTIAAAFTITGGSTGKGNLILKNITIQGATSTGAGSSSYGLYITSATKVNVLKSGTVNASGGEATLISCGLFHNGTGTVSVSSVTGADQTGNSTYSIGLKNNSTGVVNAESATGGIALKSYGVINVSQGTVNVKTAEGSNTNYDSTNQLSVGIENIGSGIVNAETVTSGCDNTSGDGIDTTSYGIYNHTGGGFVNATTVTSVGVSAVSYGVYNLNGGTVNVKTASSNTASALYADISNVASYVNTDTDAVLLTLTKNGGTCLFSSICVAASETTHIGVLPSVYKGGITGEWFTDSALTIKYTGTTISGITALYAGWDHTVTFNTNGGSVVSDITNTAILTSPVTTKADNTFAGWYTQAGLINQVSFPYTITADSTLYAGWTENTYHVVYNGNGNTGGSVPTDATGYISTGTAIAKTNSGNLLKTGYTFNGWNTNADGSGTAIIAGAGFLMGSGNKTLYAQWVQITYTVTYNGNGFTGGTVPVDSLNYPNLSTVTVLGNTGSMIRTGYIFAGWNTLANGSGTSYVGSNAFTMGSSNVVLYAKWTPLNYTVTYIANASTQGTVPTDSNTYQINQTVTLLGNPGGLIRTGYTFSGWNTAADGSGITYPTGSNYTMGAVNAIFYAKWVDNADLVNYYVTYNGNSNTGGSVPTDALVYHRGYWVLVAGNTGSLIKTGYTFAGWNTAANGTGTMYASGSSLYMGTSNVMLYAIWAENPYSIIYDGNQNTEGYVPKDANGYKSGTSATVLGNNGYLGKTGYTFDGWNTAADGSGTNLKPGDAYVLGTGNGTLYAVWKANEYSITYNANISTSGSVPNDSKTYQISDTVVTQLNSGNLAKTGYSFEGWNTSANGTGNHIAAGDTFTMGSSDIILFAQWKVSGYHIIYNGNDNTTGSVPVDNIGYKEKDEAAVLNNTGTLEKTGYTFGGWNTSADGSGTSYNSGDTVTFGTNDITLYAKWVKIDNASGAVILDNNTTSSGNEEKITHNDISTSQNENTVIVLDDVSVTADSTVLNNALGENTNSWLVLSSESVYDEVKAQIQTKADDLSVTTVGTLNIDLTRYDEDGTFQAVHQLGGTVRVTVNLTDEQIAAITDVTKAVLYYYDPETESLELVTSTFDLENKTVTFDTNHFSTFLIGISNQNQKDNTLTANQNSIVLYIALGVIAVIILITVFLIVWRKRYQD